MLRKLLDRLHPAFSKGSKLEKLYPMYEAIDTFLYTPSDTTQGPSHVRDGMNLKRMMSLVVVALLPCFFMAFDNTGYQANLAIENGQGTPTEGWRESVLTALGLGHDPGSFLDNFVLGGLYFIPVYFVTVAVGGAWEGLFASVRKHEINEGFLVTSALFPLTLPPTIPLWQVALGISFGVVIGKEIYGGIGKNFLNPALTGRAFLYFAYPTQLTGMAIWTAADGFSAATPLGAMATAKVSDTIPALTGYSWWDCFIGYIQGSMGETSTLACILGAILLIAVGIGSWRVMAGVVAGAFVTSGLFWIFSGNATQNAMITLNPFWHFVIGGFAFGTVFMATDPVSAAMTDVGRWCYGILIGVLTILIRVINPAYPEGIMLAILFGNTFAPLIDYFVVQSNIKRRAARYAA
ncbi:NADH:ubiquinone reductase (Na(+)-transporting) subunit B [Bythopirellula goksoeyrii]|uniref:Na(+)-translocating NADH-quinone reductase subunit B n=1 Tax=Bythopirellula goksoeyrii TaxID=1400387 RepID=A0A5B9QCX5_9BACT|nr:NADH:ubiquinone reductase (Na(+)-transporting) subunit B [Bythopirellula goksoeyrii]QEG35470.1 Na(+)-translocating NADH-quinone reductase subunit B [Bythopirellula goksoeyrii]